MVGVKELADVMPHGVARDVGDRLRVIAPEPTKRVGQDGGAVTRIVAFRSDDELHIVARILQRFGHRLIRQVPGAGVDALVIRAVLEEHAQGFRLHLSDEVDIAVAAPQVGVTADETENAAKCVGPLPCCRKGRNTAGAGTGNRAVVRVGG